jgi:ribosomal protein S18 acetylase RimI-like enzyme
MPDAPSPRIVHVAGAVEVVLGPLGEEERDALFALFAGVVARREGFPQAPPLTDADFDAAWGSGARLVVAARAAGELVGAYALKANFPGRAGHIANAGYVVDPRWRRRGVGRALVEDSLARARSLGFDAMQYNLVFASNPARRLYEQLGFEVTGRVPDAVDGEEALVYHRRLGPPVQATTASSSTSGGSTRAEGTGRGRRSTTAASTKPHRATSEATRKPAS